MSDTLFCTLTLSAHLFYSHALYEFNRVIKPYDVMSNVRVLKCVIFIDNTAINSKIINFIFISFIVVS